MKSRVKRLLKKATFAFTCVFLSAFIIFSGSVAPVTVLAESFDITNLTVDDTTRANWTPEQQAHGFIMEVSDTGFYTLTVTDHYQTGYILMMINNVTTQTLCGTFLQDISDPYVSPELYLCSGNEYRMVIANISPAYEYLAGDVTLTFAKSTLTPPVIPVGAAEASTLSLTLDPLNSSKWVSFTTTVAGDYLLDFSNNELEAYVSVYKSGDPNVLFDSIDTEYYTSSGEYKTKDGIILSLEANTEYYFVIDNNTSSSVTTKLAMAKCYKDVLQIQAVTYYTPGFEWDVGINNIDETSFYYKLTYTDESYDIFTYDHACYTGNELPYAEYKGDSITVNGYDILLAGEKPIVTYYKDTELVSYTHIDSVTDWLISIGNSGSSIVSTDDTYCIKYTDHSTYYLYERLKIFETGYYSISDFPYNSFDENFSKFNVEILDSNNNLVMYDEQKGGWPLVEYEDYALFFIYRFKNSAYSDVEYQLKMVNTKVFPDTSTNGWYYDALTYAAGRGTIKGYSDGRFGVSDNIQRQDFLVMLSRLDGVDLSEYENSDSEFPDVIHGSYYEAAVNWGYENGIVAGYDDGSFGVGNLITREQIVTFLRRYFAYKYANTDIYSTIEMMESTYKDYNKISPFAKDAMIWAVDNSVIGGKSPTQLDPLGYSQRCEVAQIFYNIYLYDIM